MTHVHLLYLDKPKSRGDLKINVVKNVSTHRFERFLMNKADPFDTALLNTYKILKIYITRPPIFNKFLMTCFSTSTQR